MVTSRFTWAYLLIALTLRSTYRPSLRVLSIPSPHSSSQYYPSVNWSVLIIAPGVGGSVKDVHPDTFFAFLVLDIKLKDTVRLSVSSFFYLCEVAKLTFLIWSFLVLSSIFSNIPAKVCLISQDLWERVVTRLTARTSLVWLVSYSCSRQGGLVSSPWTLLA